MVLKKQQRLTEIISNYIFIHNIYKETNVCKYVIGDINHFFFLKKK